MSGRDDDERRDRVPVYGRPVPTTDDPSSFDPTWQEIGTVSRDDVETLSALVSGVGFGAARSAANGRVRAVCDELEKTMIFIMERINETESDEARAAYRDVATCVTLQLVAVLADHQNDK